MPLHLSAGHILHSDGESESDAHSGSSQEDEQDLTWEDWVSDSADNRPCASLFDHDKTFTSTAEALNHDKLVHGFDLDGTCARLSLDPHRRIRLINWIRKEKPASSQVAALNGSETFFASDEYLIPTLEDDPLLQIQSGDWSDEDEDDEFSAPQEPEDLDSAKRKIASLEKKLTEAKQSLTDYRAFASHRLNLDGIPEVLRESAESSAIGAVPVRDDDSHYFQSYGENDIHAVMIQDKVRTATYAKFISSNAELFRGAIVLDVGCGTGILSLLAARAGAKHVFAVDASDIADRARQIVKDNDLEATITVIRGKIEEITLPESITHVDIIVSEWMGYGLLYESMLDSVLRARDRFLKPQGVMAPSQCKMQLGLCEAGEIFKERIGFWNDIYGFDLSAMGQDVYTDAIVDVVGPDTMLSDPYTIKDIFIAETTTKQLDFSTSFKLISTAERRTKIHAFVLYFDTFFTSTGERIPPGTEVYLVREGDPMLAEVWPLGGRLPLRRMSTVDLDRPKVNSFSTGPASVPTHWKQTLFLLRDPITVSEGTIVQGTFTCRKSESNTRELDVEIHYVVRESSDEAVGDAIVQIFKVR